ncbi:MAG: phosphatidylglycerophosphatase A [Pseudomonadota bacterium]
MIQFIATFGYSGRLQPAPGTWGSAAACLAAWPLHVLGGPLLLVTATVLLLFAGYWASHRYMAVTGTHDPSEITVDEAVGQWIALFPVSFGAAHADADVTALWPGVLAAFLLFRLFDIWKPGPIGWADQQPGAWGVMLDDVAAGWIASLLVAVFAFVYHGVLGQ